MLAQSEQASFLTERRVVFTIQNKKIMQFGTSHNKADTPICLFLYVIYGYTHVFYVCSTQRGDPWRPLGEYVQQVGSVRWGRAGVPRFSTPRFWRLKSKVRSWPEIPFCFDLKTKPSCHTLSKALETLRIFKSVMDFTNKIQ